MQPPKKSPLLKADCQVIKHLAGTTNLVIDQFIKRGRCLLADMIDCVCDGVHRRNGSHVYVVPGPVHASFHCIVSTIPVDMLQRSSCSCLMDLVPGCSRLYHLHLAMNGV